VCYSGDPNITASGREIRPGITVAAGPSIPFGTWLWVEDLGWRCVEDRGGNITDGRLDIAMISRDEAINFGRREVTVVIPIWR
jgi:3D (Asp-Asp-Asp) domain-containing protein